MSPSTLRRYRAERLLREEFGGLREEVLRSVRGRLRSRGVRLDEGDLEACYATAWQGLYVTIAGGEEVANPAGWLTVVTFRRAIDEHRSTAGRRADEQIHVEPDLAAELDNRAKLRQLFEALRSRLSARECEAATLCYLQGLTRAQAAQRMGISEARMTKLMEGRGPGNRGVAGKVGELLEAISGGGWCEQQGSLMRGFAFGILDPRGERYRLARLHQRECPACRAYVLSLRGLAAVLPPLPLPWGLGLTGPHHAAAGAKAGAGTGAGTITASGAAGAGGAAGGGWLVGGSVGAKLAAGCVLALSVGCVALTVAPHHAGASHRSRGRQVASASPADASIAATGTPAFSGPTALGGPISGRSTVNVVPHVSRISPAARAAALRRATDRHAQQEFGLERPASAPATSSSPQSAPVTASAASVQQAGTTSAAASTTESASAPTSAPSGPPSRAEREFGPE